PRRTNARAAPRIDDVDACHFGRERTRRVDALASRALWCEHTHGVLAPPERRKPGTMQRDDAARLGIDEVPVPRLRVPRIVGPMRTVVVVVVASHVELPVCR